jgi:PAS domain S-box-containing protein
VSGIHGEGKGRLDKRAESQVSDVAAARHSDTAVDGPRRQSDRPLGPSTRPVAPLADRLDGVSGEHGAIDTSKRLAAALEELSHVREQLHWQATALAEARSLIEAERARYRELFEVAREGHVVVDQQGLVRELNRGAAALLNLPADYLLGKPIATYVAEADRRQFRIRLHRARTRADSQEWTCTFQHFDLKPLRFSVTTSPVLNASGGVESVELLLREVSDDRAQLVASRAPAVIMRAALDALSAQIAVLDKQGRIVTVNRAWLHAQTPAGLFSLGLATGDSYVDHCAEVVAAGNASAAEVNEAVVSVLTGQRERADVIYTVAPPDDAASDDDARWFSLRVTRCDGPEPLHVVVTHEDITAERHAAVRERELLEARAARAAAEAANKAKTEFLTTLSHELRTPLNAIAGYAQLLEMGVRGPVTVAQSEDLRRILRSERHLLGLINELLNFGRLERGAVTLQIESFAVSRAVQDVMELIEAQAATQGLVLSMHCPDEALEVRADPEKLRQILLNLLSNALKFTHAGGTVRVECVASDDETYVRVRDSGIGIPAAMLDEIFDPFVQVNRGFDAPADGVGLGLAISRNLARAMGGDLSVTSALGGGSTFELRLPRARVDAHVA